MKRKINIQLLGITVIAMVATLSMVVGVFYELFQKEVVSDLKAYTIVLGKSGVFDENTYDFDMREKSIRITLIDSKGVVQYDSYANKQYMKNHLDRPEVKQALEKGEGENIRHSQTLGSNTFYYAIKLENGMVLRVAKEAESIWSVFASVFPIIGIFAIIVFCACALLAHMMTKSFVAPIEHLAKDVEHSESITTYKELMPFISTIKEQHEDIIKSAKMRQEFTANVSHELKTPLTAISGYAELIESGMATGADMRHFAGEIRQNSNRLLTLINDIIQLSELDITEVEMDFEAVDLYQIALNCVEMLKMNAKQHEISISMEGSSAMISGNKAMLEEIIVNLCDNAIRYNNKGGKVMVKVWSDEDQAVLSVKDTGIGISKENQQRIFERFYRVDKSRSKSTGGTGLGLAIVKHIVVKHNASMQVESEIGKGTEIRVIFRKIE